MSQFFFTELVNGQPADVISAALGASTSAKFAQADVGKPVKLSASVANTYVLCAAGDDLEGFVTSVDAFTVNDGFSFGSVLRNTRVTAKVGAAQSTDALAIGELVVASTPTALGTADAYPLVQGGVAAVAGDAGTVATVFATPVNFKWRVIRIVSGTGVAGDLVLIEKV